MGRHYAATGSATNTASATLPLLTLIGATSVRPGLEMLEMGSSAAPADHAANYAIQRCTSTGTPGSSPLGYPIDPADPSPVGTVGLAVFSVGPTLTSNTFLLSTGVNQRIPYRWTAWDEKHQMKIPASASNGLAVMSEAVDSAFTTNMTIWWEE